MRGGIPVCTEADPPVDRHTGVKHNLGNFVADGKKDPLAVGE